MNQQAHSQHEPRGAATWKVRLRADFGYMLQLEGRTLEASMRSIAMLIAYLAFRPGASAVLLFRTSQAFSGGGHRLLGLLIFRLNRLVNGIEISPTAQIGGGFVVYHPSGIVIGGDVVAGERLIVHTGVVIDALEEGGGSPHIGDGVMVGAGAKILGPVRLHSGAHVGANAFLLQDVPTNALAVGVPAEIRSPSKSPEH